MTKRQLGIILTLLSLIVCTALFAAKLNNEGLNNTSNLEASLKDSNGDVTDLSASSEKDGDDSEDAETISKSDYFYEARSEREQKDSATIQGLKEIIDSEDSSQERKDEANAVMQNLILIQDRQKTIELNIKNSGIEDAICNISEDQSKATVYIKSSSLDQETGAKIQEIVQNASGIKEVSIELKQ